jgi:predicted N-acetyltransferase YhbS
MVCKLWIFFCNGYLTSCFKGLTSYKDTPDVANLQRKFVSEKLSEKGDMYDIEKSYNILEDDSDSYFWVVEEDSDIIATIACLPYTLEGDKDTLELQRMSVKKSYQRRGIACMVHFVLVIFTVCYSLCFS